MSGCIACPFTGLCFREFAHLPFIAADIARAIPVLPLVASMRVSPGRIEPAFSASDIILIAGLRIHSSLLVRRRECSGDPGIFAAGLAYLSPSRQDCSLLVCIKLRWMSLDSAVAGAQVGFVRHNPRRWGNCYGPQPQPALTLEGLASRQYKSSVDRQGVLYSFICSLPALCSHSSAS